MPTTSEVTVLTTVQPESHRGAAITVLAADSERFGRLYTVRTSLDDNAEPRQFATSMQQVISKAKRYVDCCLD